MTNSTPRAPRFYAACLASYNNGVLHGAWIDATESTDEMHDAVNEMLRASQFPDAEEWAIHDSENLGDLSEYAGLDAVAERVSFYEECASAGLGSIASCIKDNDLTPDDYAGQGDTLVDWCAEFLDETGELETIPQHLRNYFDYEAYARDLELGGDIVTIRHQGTLYVFWNR